MASKAALRRYIQKRNLYKSHSLQDCSLVIDGNSFFKESYKNSGCQFLLGPDCDTYVQYLNKQIECFSACNITCYVIFRGTTKRELEHRQYAHQQIINDRSHTENSLQNTMFFEPLLVEDMQKQLLQLRGIQYFCCEYESIEAIIGVARSLKCPVLTDNIEYCLYGVSCILPRSLKWEKTSTAVRCTMYDHEQCKFSIGVHYKMPILLTVLSMISEFPECGNLSDISSIICWVKRQQKNAVMDIGNNIIDLKKRKIFFELLKKNNILYSYPSCNLAVKYFQRNKFYGLFKDDKKWFSKGVSNGRIALPYVDMKRKSFVTGSMVLNDILKHDAIIAAAPIISYAHCVLTNSQKSTLKYIGRKNSICTTWDYEYSWKEEIRNRDIFNKYGKFKKKPFSGNPFYLFVKEILSVDVAEDVIRTSALSSSELKKCIILVVTLVYYVQKVNKKFIDFAYYIFLCYTILGPVRHNMTVSTLSILSQTNKYIHYDCRDMYEKLKFLFESNENQNYDISILHNLSEFLHCLQHMNYLNKLWGQNVDNINVPETIYFKTYNATFVYNTYMFMNNKNELMSYLDNNFKDSWGLKLYKHIISKFTEYLHDTDVQKPLQLLL